MKRKDCNMYLMTGNLSDEYSTLFCIPVSRWSVFQIRRSSIYHAPGCRILCKKMGFKPKGPRKPLAGDYQFNSGHITRSIWILDTSGAQINKHKGIRLQYLKKRTIIPPNRFPCLPKPASGQSLSKRYYCYKT